MWLICSWVRMRTASDSSIIKAWNEPWVSLVTFVNSLPQLLACFKLSTVDVLFFAVNYFRGHLIPNQLAGIKNRATSTGCDIYTIYIYICGDHVTAIINTQLNLLLLQYPNLTRLYHHCWSVCLSPLKRLLNIKGIWCPRELYKADVDWRDRFVWYVSEFVIVVSQ